MAAKHTPPQDGSFRASLAKHLGGGVALILLVAVAFYGIGRVGQEDGAPSAADVPDRTEEGEAADDEAGDGTEEEPDEAEEPVEEPDPDDDEPDEAERETGDAEAEDPDEDAEGEESDADRDEEADEPEDDAPTAYDPSEISLQVLDGVGTDGGNAAGQMAQRLRDGGFDVVAQNPAIAYQTTTVLWTSGNEDKARQVAAEIGAGDVREQPGNLSESVDVHVVVGADRA